ncbi:uncharacterized protein A1O9_07064 [Exophiala aquamarina CBS 119918]|uniref:Zn(2)-C6 fungal-type domain-containing protein n=1 Tax=Exophiala aquamarina CBS 119918 TaxID=1182545 RepID=A0A072P9U0_9EURO|nr:uncharacterized protein A1O9_07064 [Exophiala aquamarina CBS 119918]KEF56874.1 hypothetical protein A1O9_07064 [Exophiala aquamarina CBS 119918]
MHIQTTPRLTISHFWQCDQRKPSCLKCEKSRYHCPGYRDLHQVLFRDESERVRQKAYEKHLTQPNLTGGVVRGGDLVQAFQPLHSATAFLTSNLSCGLSHPLGELGMNFFFTRYTFDQPPFSHGYSHWLAQACFGHTPNHALQAAIEAVGTAALANVFHAPSAAAKSKKQYSWALMATKRALNNPTQALADETMMAIILLGLFETVTFDTWDHYQGWETHVQGATALLELRGRQQFNTERGGQLFIQLRSQILSTCMQRHIPVPKTLMQMWDTFYTSKTRKWWQRRNLATSNSICEISFRLVNLRAALRNGKIAGAQTIIDTAIAIDEDLVTWRTTMPLEWNYTTVDAPDNFGGTAHTYPNLWVAEAWKNWRILRILVNQTIYENGGGSSQPSDESISKAPSVIRESSWELCICCSNFMGTPRVPTLIEPLYLVAMEYLNPLELRHFAIEQLRSIDTTMGIRHASLLAGMAYESLMSNNPEHVLTNYVATMGTTMSPSQVPAISFA